MNSLSQTFSGFMPERVVHLHPSRFCNLTCQHCYSSSSPRLQNSLDIDLIINTLTILIREGYNVLSISGGEPLLYADIQTLLARAKELGYKTSLITNGSAINNNNIDWLIDNIEMIAISVDGTPELHNKIRNHPQAFRFVENAINYLTQYEVAFGIAFCVSHLSINDIPWIVDYAEEHNASLLQLHPFASTGRGTQMNKLLGLDGDDMVRTYVVASLLENASDIPIQLDLLPIDQIRKNRARYKVLERQSTDDVVLSDLISPIVITDEGNAIPFTYGINPNYYIGKIGMSFETSISHYKKKQWTSIRDLIDYTFSSLDDQTQRFIDWFQYMSEISYHLQQTTHD